jgi:hypothetical protein
MGHTQTWAQRTDTVGGQLDGYDFRHSKTISNGVVDVVKGLDNLGVGKRGRRDDQLLQWTR